MGSPSIGLYLGTETADIVCLTGSFQHPRLLSFGSIPLPSEEIWRSQTQSGETEIPQEAVQAIRTLLQKTEPSSSRVYTAIASEACIIRYFQMPILPTRERKQAIAFEAKKYLPFKLEELDFDFKVVIQRKAPSLMRVMFLGVKKNLVAAVMSLLSSADLTPLCLETTPLSLMRLLRQNGQLLPGEVALFLSIEQDTATISIARQDLLYLSRNVTTLGSVEAGQNPAEPLETLTTETRVSMDYYRRRFPGEPSVSRVLLFGKNIDSKRAKEFNLALDVPVEIGHPFRKITLNHKEAAPGLAVAAGLALRGMEKRTGEPNLLPLEIRRNLQSLFKMAVFQGAVGMILLGVWTIFSMVDLHGLEQKAELIRLGKTASVSFAPNQELLNLKTLSENQQKELQFLRSLSKTKTNSAELFSELGRLLPEETWVQHALMEDGPQIRTLKLVGAAYDNNREKELEGINRFLASLRSNPLFQSTFGELYLDNVRRSRFREEEITQFRLTCASGKERKGASP
ncbi:MAG: pilus assembly protein PilM [Candidatus Omnitrophica bacterium]|nr:pilus assembly protein PilM [Candidatus Omnitrophota bacterium]